MNEKQFYGAISRLKLLLPRWNAVIIDFSDWVLYKAWLVSFSDVSVWRQILCCVNGTVLRVRDLALKFDEKLRKKRALLMDSIFLPPITGALIINLVLTEL